MDHDEVIHTLNDLIETTKDGEEGFRTCAENIGDTSLKSFFSNRAQSCAAAAAELQNLVRNYGGDPEKGSGLGGAIHRRWVDIKATLLGGSDASILKECARGETVAVASYRRALERNLPVDVRGVVEKQYQGVLQNHDHVRSLLDQSRIS
ncbi:ferritin-like domain-containing protein [Noviherbaspirillum galbum]|uniref:PA2169 family four-helix-bundle protein n=1 Tax=Noviherbaspirillum galbum TaxID=2709383 RepID=A0A6B3SYI3_9BURK|nr:PA2169 family four-helix-bundle protein [Noviherbaspirillum galbum]NEX63792.1 PA2169 family four-helix-bundle protein [Noviherbaspirillum galbum]